jgi:hypothetical protein
VLRVQDQGLLNRDGSIGYNIAEAQQRDAGTAVDNNDTQAIRVNVLNESLREVTSSRIALVALVVVNVPQVLVLHICGRARPHISLYIHLRPYPPSDNCGRVRARGALERR